MTDVIRVGNCSGFYGDRLSAMREMLDGGDLDYLTGDYLAELTMLILGRDRMKDPAKGYAKTYLRQLEDCLGTAIDKGVTLVSSPSPEQFDDFVKTEHTRWTRVIQEAGIKDE